MQAIRLASGYGIALLASIAVAAIYLAARPFFVHSSSALFLAVVAISAWRGGFGPGVLATAAGALTIDYLFLEPISSLGLASSDDAVRLGEFSFVGLLITFLSAHLRAARRDAEASLAMLDTLLVSSPVGMGLLDRDLRVVRLNESLAQIADVPLRESLGRPVHELLPQLWPTLEPLVRRVITRSEPVINREVSGETRAAPGEPRTWLVSYYPIRVGQRDVIGVGSVVVDVTERKRAAEEQAQLAREQAVRAAVEGLGARLEVILDRAPAGIIFVEAATGNLLANRRARDLFGCPLTAAGGQVQYVDQIRYPDGRAVPLAELPSTRALRGESPPDEELVIHRRDGRKVPVIESAAPVRSSTGEIQGAVLSLQDISPLKDLEQLREEFMAAVAHELRSPVTVIRGQAQLALITNAREDRARRAFGIIVRQSDHIARMIDDLLTVIQIRRGWSTLSTGPVDLGSDVRYVVGQAARDHGNVQFHVEAGDSLIVAADRRLIDKAVAHLLANAARYSPDGGSIEVAVRCRQNDVVFSVTDHGVGIPVERQTHVFEPFYVPIPSGEAGYVGTVGLDLYVSKQIIDAHRGRIWYESTPGQGSTFSFSLPRAERPDHHPGRES